MRLFLGLFLILIVGCGSEIQENELTKLNGYWEISEVSFTHGATKKYTASTTIDYLEIENLKGFRKKVQPQLKGTFETSNDAKPFTILKTKNGFDLEYPSKNSQKNSITEHLIELSENTFSVKDEEGTTYVYKRFKPLNLQK